MPLVPPVGLEPTCLAAADFESAASTNSTTGASRGGADLSKSAPSVNVSYCGVSRSVPLPFWPLTVQYPSSDPSSLRRYMMMPMASPIT